MGTNRVFNDPAKRRIFIKDGEQAFQIFSVAQEKDGSIYISSPDFAQSKWLELSLDPSSPSAKAAQSPGTGKLSVHASGFAGVRAHDSRSHKFPVIGSRLVDVATNTHSVRHLTTVLISRPNHVPAGNRHSDYLLEAQRIKPIAFVFFAVPRSTGLKGVKVEWSFHVDVIGVPPDVSWGEIPLPLHSLVWIAYSTKQMTRWPASSHYCHYDGYLVPLFMGGGPTTWTFCAVRPAYAITGTELVIRLDSSAFDGGVAAPSEPVSV